MPDCPKDGVLYEAVGPVNSIYTIVDIQGYLYLTRGAVLSYYEFTEPDLERLTDEEWQMRVAKRKLPSIPDWYENLVISGKYKPKLDEKMHYGFNYDLIGPW